MTPDLRQTLVVVPAFNEEASIKTTLAELKSVLPGVNCLVVDDGSRDQTARIAKSAGVTVASFPFNMGVGGAMRFGFRYAVTFGYANVVQFDADGQHDPAYIKTLVSELSHSDIVIGARFAGVGDYRVRGPRQWAMKFLSAVISKSAHTLLTDTTSGFRAAGPRAVPFFADGYPAEYLGDTIESLVTALRAGLTVSQVPVAMRLRSGGQPSQNSWRSFLFLFRALIALCIAYIRPKPSNHFSDRSEGTA